MNTKRTRAVSAVPAPPRFDCSVLTYIVGLAFGLGLASTAWGQSPSCPNPPPAIITSSQVPTDVCIPAGFLGNPIQFFDDFSWRSVIALVWPAQQGQRGVPDPNQQVGAVSGPLVFETFKADWELFQPNGADPSPTWNDFAGGNNIAVSNPCGVNVNVGFNDFVLASFSKFINLGQAGFGDLVHALPAQNKTWVRYATAFNQIEFTQIVPNKWYLRQNLPATITFQDGALDVKSAWIDMKDIQRPERYYRRTAWLLDPVTGTCSQKTVGLVGLHIVQKTPSRPQWIWSSFEQVDTVPPQPGAPGPFGFNDGSGQPMPASDPNGGWPPNDVQNPIVFNVQRLKPIHASTQATNSKYQQALGGVWQFYQLVMTQWPVPGNTPQNSGAPRFTFPGRINPGDDTTSFANTTLETWEQKAIPTGCMACHNMTRTQTDFLWSLQINAYPPTILLPPGFRALGSAAPMSAAEAEAQQLLKQLKALMKEAQSKQ